MMTPDEYSSWLTLGNHTPEAMALITRIRNSEPSRRVRGGRSNVIASFPSKKMGFTIQAESHRVELPIIHKFENDDSVLEYYDQPEPIKISWSRKDGRKVTVFSTVDFFLLMRDGRAGWVECKTEEDLKRQSLESNRFVIDDYGTWHCPCGEEYATLFGFFFTVETNANINWTYYRNTNYLQDYFRDEATIISQERKTYITALVSAMQGTCLATLYDMQDELSRDDILFLVAKGDLYINLEAHDLAMPKNAPVYTSELIAKSHIDTYAVQKAASIEPSGFILDIGCLVSWDSKPYRIINLGEQEIWMESLDGNIAHLSKANFSELVNSGLISRTQEDSQDIMTEVKIADFLRTKSRRDQEKGLQKYNCILPHLRGEKIALTSTQYLWIRQYKSAEVLYGCGFMGLIGNISARGNRKPKLHGKAVELMNTCIKKYYLDNNEHSKNLIYGHYLVHCHAEGVAAASYKTFAATMNKQDPVKVIKAKQGRKAAYQAQTFHWELSYTTARHGVRPFEVVHIDHTELDWECYDSSNQENLGRPWLTIMIDAYSRMVLAFYLTFMRPNYSSCMMVLRNGVRRFNRFPQTIVVDNGDGFRSTQFDLLLARYECTKKHRPPSEPRSGSILERFFGTINNKLLYNMIGNTKHMKNPRTVSTSHNPEYTAVWPLHGVQDVLEKYIFDFYANQKHSALGSSPKSVFNIGLLNHGYRYNKFITYDYNFILSTLPTTKNGFVTVHRQKGVKYSNIYYWHDAFSNPELHRTKVPILYDPLDVSKVYIYTKHQGVKQWLMCISEYSSVFNGLSEKHIGLASAEIRKRKSITDSCFRANAAELACFIEMTKYDEAQFTQDKYDKSKQAALNNPEDIINTCESSHDCSDKVPIETTSNDVYEQM